MNLKAPSLVAIVALTSACSHYYTDVRDERVVDVERVSLATAGEAATARLAELGLTIVRDDGVTMTWPGPVQLSATAATITVDGLDGHSPSVLARESVRTVDMPKASIRRVSHRVRDPIGSAVLTTLAVLAVTAVVGTVVVFATVKPFDFAPIGR